MCGLLRREGYRGYIAKALRVPTVKYKVLGIIPGEFVADVFFWVVSGELYALTEDKIHFLPPGVIGSAVGNVRLGSRYPHGVLGG